METWHCDSGCRRTRFDVTLTSGSANKYTGNAYQECNDSQEDHDPNLASRGLVARLGTDDCRRERNAGCIVVGVAARNEKRGG